jgi:hypothetical protein
MFRRSALILLALVVVIVSLLGIQPAPPSSPSSGASQTALDPSALPGIVADPDTAPIELGLRFSSSVSGTVDQIKFFKGPQNTGVHTGSLWTSSGTLLSRITFTNETATGWQSSNLPNPVPITAGKTYVVSYHAPAGRYAADESIFTGPSTRGSITLQKGAGVYAYGGTSFPSSTHRNSNYFVDLAFTPSSSPTRPAPTEPPGAEPSAGPSTGTLRQVDGGPDYYGQFANPLPTDPSFFPLGVWYESILSPSDVARDQSAGLNLYVELTNNSDTSLLGPDGPYAITSGDEPGISGRITADEADMWGGPGAAGWTGNYPGEGTICSPSNGRCGYTIMDTSRERIAPGVMAYTNYGKGVTFWQSRKEAARFVNDYQDVVSADNYWFTDPYICGSTEGGKLADGRKLSQAECRLAANYGWTVDRLRSLVQPAGSQPVWAFVEVGHPFTENHAPTITGPQLRAAVWSSIIHGARGVIYFNHSFGGKCISQHVLRDGCGSGVRPAVTEVNNQITSLAPVLNAPFLDGVTTTESAVDHMTKVHDGQVYIFAGSAQADAQTATIANACVGNDSLSVLGENRTITANDGRFTDHFADGNTVHIYSAAADPRCLR